MRSSIGIYDVAAREERAVFETESLIEAPNWSPDGLFLIVNGNGRVYRLNLADLSALVEIDTGFAVACNNDHGISPDGKTLVISDAGETSGSCIYTLPIGGGAPTRVTDDTPSYWHGWSPDGLTLTYCGERRGRHDIYTVPAGGGAERRLTEGHGHNDGPDYSPDGAWIWFNSNRSGGMQLWRMRPDGSEPEQMTHDERANWFPHPSPDGRAVLYMAYEPGVEGHPSDHEVELRLMDPNGGNVRSVVALFGGQGSINVPCWAPGGGRFAFIRYARPRG